VASVRGKTDAVKEQGPPSPWRAAWHELGTALSIAVVLAFLAAGASAACVSAEQEYWSAGYYRLIRNALWERFDRWSVIAAGVGLVLVGMKRALGLWGRASARGAPSEPGMRVRRGAVALAVVVGGLRVLGLVDSWRLPPAANVLLISIDTLRPDRLDAYGYDPQTSPTITNELAARGVTFENCYSQSPKTTPSHMTMLTSLYPCVHGIPLWEGNSPGPVLNPVVHTLAEVLQNAGYATGAFTGIGHVDRSRGFGQGFDVYEHGHQLPRATRWLRRHTRRPFFMFFHTYAVHDPYLPPPRLIALFDKENYQGPLRDTVLRLRRRPEEWEHAHRIFWEAVDRHDPEHVRFVQRLYDAGILHMDESILAPLLRELESLGLEENTLVILTSDHGEAFGEHGEFLHHDLYAETLRVPLIMRFPDRLAPGSRVSRRVRIVDLMPTILDLLGIDAPAVLQGSSLVGLLDIEGRSEPAWDVPGEYSTPSDDRIFESIRDDHLTYIVDRGVEQLFDRKTDPGEQVDIASGHAEGLAAARSALAEWRAECRRLAADLGPQGDAVSPDEETFRQLRALGYVE
jgi:arylsulfatase A-like enzyme